MSSIFKVLCVFGALSLSAFSFADHTLGDVVFENLQIRFAVEQVIAENNVVCNLDNSSQAYFHRSEVRTSDGTAWKQIALCYTQVGVDENYYPKFHDIDLIGVLVVSYTWVDFGPGELLSVSYN